MKRCALLFALVFCFLGVNSAFAQSTRVMTYNIRYATDSDGNNSWENRKQAMVNLLQHYQPDIFGVQEGLHHQLEYLQENLDNYQYIGIGRDDGQTRGEYSAIFFDTTKFMVTLSNTFWLSDTPETVSLGWGANYHRVCTYGVFTNKVSGQKALVMNTHFDHQSVLARDESAQLILQKMKAINTNNLSVVLMGDFNTTPETPPISIVKTVMADSFNESAKPHYGPVGSFNDFDPNLTLDERIDYIFIKGIKVNSHIHIDDRRPDSFFVSDHLPVMVELEF